jgi:hypothetical protein
LVSIPTCISFLFYERLVTIKHDGAPEPVFPWRFCRSRVIMGILM